MGALSPTRNRRGFTDAAEEDHRGDLQGIVYATVGAGAQVFIVVVTLAQKGTIGGVLMNVGLFQQAQVQVKVLAADLVNLYKNTIFLEDVTDLAGGDSSIEGGSGGHELKGPVESIRFEGVSFRYPYSSRQALRNGSPAEEGSFAELLAREGEFYRLFKRQERGYAQVPTVS